MDKYQVLWYFLFMTTFAPAVHTPEALATEIGRIHDDSDATRLVGSLGRAVIYGEVLGNPNYEYQQRQQDPLRRDHTARDIDLVSGQALDPGGYEPFPVDASVFASPFMQIEVQDGEWFLTSSLHGFAEPLHEDVVAPVIGETAFGIPAVTLPPHTLLSLYGRKGQLRRKDQVTKDLFQALCEDLPPEASLPPELFEPFDRLTAINRTSWHFKAQNIYRRMVPEQLQIKLVPVTRSAKKLIGWPGHERQREDLV